MHAFSYGIEIKRCISHGFHQLRPENGLRNWSGGHHTDEPPFAKSPEGKLSGPMTSQKANWHG